MVNRAFNRVSAFASILAVMLCITFAHSSAMAAEGPQRIVSLAPAITEILFAMRLGDRVAGVTSYCDHPEEALSKPKVGGMSNPSIEAVLRLRPDLVILTKNGNPKEFDERLRGMGISTYVFSATRILDLPDALREMGRALGADKEAEALAKKIENAVSMYAMEAVWRKKVAFIVWPEPLILAGPGTAIDDAIRLRGYANIAYSSPLPYPKYSIEEFIRSAPDIIIIGKGHGIQEASEGLLKRLASVPAIRNGRVYFVGDGLYRMGPRVIDGLYELAEILKGAE